MPHVLPIALAASATVALVSIGLQAGGDSPSDHAVAGLANQLGFSAEACAVAGLTPSETRDALERLAAAESLRLQHAQARIALDLAMNEFERANDLVSAGALTESTLQARETARAAMDRARADLEQSREYLLALLTAECDDQELERLQNFAASGAHSVPAEYRVVGFTEAGWEEVAAAWRLQRRVEAGVFEAEDADLAAIAALDSSAEVEAARARLEGQLNSHRAVFGDFSG